MAAAKDGDLTLLERKAIHAYVANGGHRGQAVVEAGSKSKHPRMAAYEIFQRPRVQSYLQKLLNRQGLTDTHLVRKIKGGLDAEKVISAFVLHAPYDADRPPVEATERSPEFLKVPDWSNRHKYLETTLKLKGHLTEREAEPSTVIYNLISFQSSSPGRPCPSSP